VQRPTPAKVNSKALSTKDTKDTKDTKQIDDLFTAGDAKDANTDR
jgi:hypothetical protein